MGARYGAKAFKGTASSSMTGFLTRSDSSLVCIPLNHNLLPWPCHQISEGIWIGDGGSGGGADSLAMKDGKSLACS